MDKKVLSLLNYEDIDTEAIEKLQSEFIVGYDAVKIESRVKEKIIDDEMVKGISRLQKHLEKNEEILYKFKAFNISAIDKGILKTKEVAKANLFNNEWGVNTVVIVTNKKMFVIRANIFFEWLRITAYDYKYISYIKTIEDNTKLIFIKPRGSKRFILQTSDREYTDAINFIKHNDFGVKVKIDSKFLKFKKSILNWMG
ncbi:PH domain-containing protein [Clostridium sp. YIM B02505]|uniref:PH domain-containing protein n=1 Tax=Clostridium yunnanense TaxID=2800325 RepID=A0ABS1EJS0_9CLOT|nr:PH domain-containing protein [Clostridium yunnanense]MBK1809607.1 PH domain-containing protein [Clostridium yunnanense]